MVFQGVDGNVESFIREYVDRVGVSRREDFVADLKTILQVKGYPGAYVKLQFFVDKSVEINVSNKVRCSAIKVNYVDKVDKELDKKINESQSVIEKNKIDSLSLVNDQIQEITKLTLSKVTSFKVTNEDIKKAILNAEKKIN